MTRFLLTLLTSGLLLALPAHADIYVVAAAQSPLKVGSAKDIQALFMGRTRTLGEGPDIAQPLDLPRDHELRNQFYKVLTGWSPAQVNSYWARLLFTGQVAPPLPLSSEAAVIDHLVKHPNAVGYLTQAPAGGRLKVLWQLRTDDGTDAPARSP